MIQIKDLSKSYGNVIALQGVTFKVAAGEIVGLLGPNGAGKTTIIKTLTGYLQPDSGIVSVGGFDILTQTREIQTQIGYLPESAPLYPELTVQAYLQMMANLRSIPEDQQLRYISEAVYAVALEEYLTRPIGHLSKGYRQRVGLAQAILHKPKLLILDEPTVGLDPTQIVEIRHLIKRLSKHSTVLFSTHILAEVEAVCDRVLILMNGSIKADSRLEDLAVSQHVLLELEKSPKGVIEKIKALQKVGQVSLVSESSHDVYHIENDGNPDLSMQLFQLAAKESWPVRELRHEVRNLESVFNELAVAG
ncbi:MAG: ATP-binding cassette domain-containing protein [Anaerolineaceae bacterium]|nr:ATP-binding cassette domain-containing protein [Anaerolineaceae bacterium]